MNELSHLVESKLRNLTELVEKLQVKRECERHGGQIGGEGEAWRADWW